MMLCGAVFACSSYSQHTLRLMTYNIRNANGMDGIRNYQRIANVITEAGADVIAVQETDSMTRRSGEKYVLGEIAERARMQAYFAPAIPHDQGKYGIGILTKRKPLRLETVPLPGREEARVMLVAEFEDYVYACTHLSLTEADRMASVEKIRETAATYHKPFFLAGDMNAEPDEDFIKAVQKDFEMLSNPKYPTYPSLHPGKTIDYIFVFKPTAGAKFLKGSRVVNDTVASDHRPVTVDLCMAEKPDRLFRARPYLQNPLDGGMTVMWETTVPSYSWVEYGTDTTRLKRARTVVDGQVVCNRTLHKIRLDSLQPGQTYYYRVCSQEILSYQAYKKVFGNTARSAFSHFTLPSADADSFTAVVFNDLHKQGATFEALCRQIQDINYDFAVFNGDCVDDPANPVQATKFISQLTEGVHGDCIPVFFMRGNHEIRNAYSIGLRDHYDYPGNKTYGAFNWGDTRIVMLDCGEDKEDSHWVYYDLNDFTRLRHEQVDFLRTELSGKAFKKARKRILIHHIPLYGNDGKNLCEELWTPLLSKAPFHVSLNAHTHQFAYHPKGELGNNYPVVIGGGYSINSATVMIIQKKKETLTVKVLNTKGDVLLELNL